ncbi:MAG: HAD family hydrolase, partial [Rufibacter sp.]
MVYHRSGLGDHARPTLVFVTGRALETVMPLLSDPTIPRPDY